MADAWRGRGFFIFLQLASRGQTGLCGAALSTFNNTLLSPTPVDYSCRFRCTLSSFPRSLRPPRPCRWHTCMSTGCERMNVHAHVEKPAVTSTPFHATPPYATPSFLFIHVSFQVPVPVPLSPCPALLLPPSPCPAVPSAIVPSAIRSLSALVASRICRSRRGRRDGKEERRAEKERICRVPAEARGKEKSISLVVFPADHDLDYGPDFHLICSFLLLLLFLQSFFPFSCRFQPFSSFNSELYDVESKRS